MADRAAGRRHGGFAGRRGIEQVARDQDKFSLVRLDGASDSPNYLETLLLDKGALLRIVDPSERFA